MTIVPVDFTDERALRTFFDRFIGFNSCYALVREKYTNMLNAEILELLFNLP